MILLLVLFLLLAVAGYAWFIEPAQLDLREEEVEIDPSRLTAPLRLLFLSDLHAGRFTWWPGFQRKLRRLRAAHARQPFQALLFGGDYLDADPRYLPLLVRMLGEFATLGIPMYGVLGNHDYCAYQYEFPAELVKALEAAGLTILRNQVEVLKVGGQKLALVGLDELESSPLYGRHGRGEATAECVSLAAQLDWYARLDKEAPGLPRLLLTHNPDGVYLPGERVPDLVLAGHTHGGQMAWLRLADPWLPASMSRRALPKGSFRTWAGRRLLQRTTLLVGRGWDGSSVPLRFLCRPQALALTLRPATFSPTLVIGLSGKPRSGKDTVSGMLASLFPGIRLVTIGDAVKREYDRLHGTNTLHNLEEKLAHRDGINALGKERRDQDRDYWVRQTITQKPPLLVTDVRWPHEAEVVHQAQGFLIRVEADRQTLQRRMEAEFHGHIDNHFESQMDSYDRWDFVIHNNGTLAELEAQVVRIAQAIKAGQG